MWEVCEICGAITGIGMADKHAQWHEGLDPVIEEEPHGN